MCVSKVSLELLSCSVRENYKDDAFYVGFVLLLIRGDVLSALCNVHWGDRHNPQSALGNVFMLEDKMTRLKWTLLHNILLSAKLPSLHYNVFALQTFSSYDIHFMLDGCLINSLWYLTMFCSCKPKNVLRSHLQSDILEMSTQCASSNAVKARVINQKLLIRRRCVCDRLNKERLWGSIEV